MAGYESVMNGFEWWWLIPLVMVVVCFYMVRGRGAMMMCGRGIRRATDEPAIASSDSAMEILDKRLKERDYSEEKILHGSVQKP